MITDLFVRANGYRTGSWARHRYGYGYRNRYVKVSVHWFWCFLFILQHMNCFTSIHREENVVLWLLDISCLSHEWQNALENTWRKRIVQRRARVLTARRKLVLALGRWRQVWLGGASPRVWGLRRLRAAHQHPGNHRVEPLWGWADLKDGIQGPLPSVSATHAERWQLEKRGFYMLGKGKWRWNPPYHLACFCFRFTWLKFGNFQNSSCKHAQPRWESNRQTRKQV